MILLRRLLTNVRGIIMELSDGNAYQRHLRRHDRVHSPQEYRRFQTEHYGRKYQRARCC